MIYLNSFTSFPVVVANSQIVLLSNLSVYYSVRLVNPSYTGAIIQLRRSSDNVLQDFYTDATQSYLTSQANNTGTTFISWIGGSTAYIRTWYDQSNNANHCSNTTNSATQPTLTLQSGRYVATFNSANSTVLTTTNGFVPYAIFSRFYYMIVNFNTILSTPLGPDVGFRLSNNSLLGDSNTSDLYATASGTKLNYVNGISTTVLAMNTWLNTSVSMSSPMSNSMRQIGSDGIFASRGLTGYMTEMICYSNVVTATDCINYTTV
jgi:hypothetical protein